MMFLTIPIILYQLLFVGILFFTSRLGRAPLNIALAACLLWTATHIFLAPLAVLQTTVIMVSYTIFRRHHKPHADTSGS